MIWNRRKKSATLLVVVACLGAIAATDLLHAAEYTWIGGDGIWSEWHDADHWRRVPTNAPGLPGEISHVIFNDGVVNDVFLDRSTTIDRMSVGPNYPYGTAEITAAGDLTIKTALVVQGPLTGPTTTGFALRRVKPTGQLDDDEHPIFANGVGVPPVGAIRIGQSDQTESAGGLFVSGQTIVYIGSWFYQGQQTSPYATGIVGIPQFISAQSINAADHGWIELNAAAIDVGPVFVNEGTVGLGASTYNRYEIYDYGNDESYIPAGGDYSVGIRTGNLELTSGTVDMSGGNSPVTIGTVGATEGSLVQVRTASQITVSSVSLDESSALFYSTTSVDGGVTADNSSTAEFGAGSNVPRVTLRDSSLYLNAPESSSPDVKSRVSEISAEGESYAAVSHSVVNQATFRGHSRAVVGSSTFDSLAMTDDTELSVTDTTRVSQLELNGDSYLTVSSSPTLEERLIVGSADFSFDSTISLTGSQVRNRLRYAGIEGRFLELSGIGENSRGTALYGNGFLEVSELKNSGRIFLGRQVQPPSNRFDDDDDPSTPPDAERPIGRISWNEISQPDIEKSVTAHYYVSGDLNLTVNGTVDVRLGFNERQNPDTPNFINTGIWVGGAASIGGTVKVALDGYQPDHGDKFTLVYADSISGRLTRVDSPLLEFNKLPLVPVHSAHSVSLVVPQKVVLNWGRDFTNYGIAALAKSFGATLVTKDPSQSLAAAQVDASLQEAIRQAVQRRFDNSGVESVVVVNGESDPEAINVYILDEFATLGIDGLADKIDRMNRDSDNDVWARYRPLEFHNTVDTISHEIGHALGLRHVYKAGEDTIMDYIDSGHETLFLNSVAAITEEPLPLFEPYPVTHNPLFHLRHYVDKVSVEDLAEDQIYPGDWDKEEFTIQEYRAIVKEWENADLDLYSVKLFVEQGTERGDAIMLSNLMAEYAHLKLSDLADLSLSFEPGSVISLLAASMPGGEFDIALTGMDPFAPGSLQIAPGRDSYLNLQTSDGFKTLAVLAFQNTSQVPEPTSLILLLLAATLTSVAARPTRTVRMGMN